jgi:peptidyl-prolyl cis-trans isomerase C
MIRRGLLLAEAKKHALDKTPDYQQRLQDATQTLLMQAAVAKYLTENPVTDADLRAAYNAFVVRLGNTEYKLRGLRLESEADAQKVLARLKDGKKFERLAREYAEGPDKEKAGELDWRAPTSLPPAVAAALHPLKKGDYTPTPIPLDTGWHLFLLEDLRPLTPPALEQIKAQLAQGLVQAKIAQYLQRLRAQADIK